MECYKCSISSKGTPVTLKITSWAKPKDYKFPLFLSLQFGSSLHVILDHNRIDMKIVGFTLYRVHTILTVGSIRVGADMTTFELIKPLLKRGDGDLVKLVHAHEKYSGNISEGSLGTSAFF